MKDSGMTAAGRYFFAFIGAHPAVIEDKDPPTTRIAATFPAIYHQQDIAWRQPDGAMLSVRLINLLSGYLLPFAVE